MVDEGIKENGYIEVVVGEWLNGESLHQRIALNGVKPHYFSYQYRLDVLARQQPQYPVEVIDTYLGDLQNDIVVNKRLVERTFRTDGSF